MESIAFIGLGDLGSPIARNLLDAGYPLTVYNRTASKAEPLLAQGAKRAETASGAITPGGIAVTLLWDDASVENIVNDTFLNNLGKDGLHISMTTIKPETSKRLAGKHANAGTSFIEAPIFGRPEAAAAKQLWIPCAGPKEAKERAKPILEAMGAQGVYDLGETIGAATTAKLFGNFLIISATRSLNEGAKLARESGVDPAPMIDMLTQTLFNAPIYKSYGKMIAENKAAPMQSAIPAKDINLFIQTAEPADTPTPIARTLRQLLT